METTDKLKALKDMNDIYNTNDQEIGRMEQRIADLNEEMSRYVFAIQSSADRYRQCTS